MKTTATIFTLSLALALSLLAVEAHAHGHSGGSHSANVSHSPSPASYAKTGFQQGTFQNSKNLGQVNKLNTLAEKNLAGKLNLNKGLAANLKKDGKFNFNKGLKKGFPGKFWWGYGDFCWGGCWYDGCCDHGWPGCYCCQPWYANPYCNVYCQYKDADDPSGDAVEPSDPRATTEPATPVAKTEPALPVAKIVRIVNPAQTRTTLGFAVNGQAYSLEAGKTQELELTENTVIEFDRGSDNATGRYTLSEGAYRFASTPQGWELYRSNDAAQADAVAAD